MRKTLLSTTIVAVLLGASSLCQARADSPEEAKPLAVVAFSNCDELLADVEYLAELFDDPKLSQGVEGIRGVLAALDTKRPWGAVVELRGDRLTGYGFLPVTDAKQLRQLLKPLISEVTEVGDGVFKVQGKLGRPLYVKEKEGGWLFASDNPETLAATPDDPCELIAGLAEQYDAALRLYVCNAPEEHRRKFIAKVKQHVEKELQRKDGEDEHKCPARRIVAERLRDAVIHAANEIEQVTYGWSLDREAGSASIEVSATALAGTNAAEQLATLGTLKSSFGGFRLPGATLAAVAVCKYTCSDGDRQELAALFDAIRAKAFEKIDAKEKSDERAEAGKQIVDGLLQVMEETVASGRAEGGLALMLKPKGVTLTAGRYIANGKKLEETLGQLVEAVRRECPDFVEKVLETNVAEHNGVHFHAISLPIPDGAKDRERLVQALGDPLVIVVGIGPHSVYVSVGKRAEKALRQAIKRSKAGKSEAAPPVEISVSLLDVARFVAAVGKPKQKTGARKAIAALKGAPDKDHVNVSIVPIERGLKVRLEAEEGVLRLLGTIRKKK